MKAVYRLQTSKAPGIDKEVEVVNLESKMYAEIEYKDSVGHKYKKWVATKKLKPYLDPDADGKQWLFLDYIIMEQDHPKLLKFAVYTQDNRIVDVVDRFLDAKRIIIEDILGGKEKHISINACTN